MQAIIQSGPGILQLAENVPKPLLVPGSGKVLVKVHAVALNHSDWKMVDFSAKPGAVSGYDMAGVLEAIDESVNTSLVVGDRVLGVTSIHGGAFAEYVLTDGDLLIKIPQNMDFQTAASYGVGIVTTGLALYGHECLALAWPNPDGEVSAGIPKTRIGPRGWSGGDALMDDDNETPRIPVLVYGASTSTGTLAIQLLQLSGYEPIAVCSPHNFGLVQSRGASKCFDYHSSGCGAMIKQYTHNRLEYALDCITTASSMRLCYEAIGAAGGKYVSLDPFNARVQRSRADVKPFFCYALTIFGIPIELDGEFARDAKPEDRKLAEKFVKIAEKFIEKGKLKAHPTTLKSGGLNGIVGAIDLLRKGKVSGSKLVFNVVDG
ncbi:Trans-enoyl reductase boa5 [Ciborinia camelliae]|nr:Trans-enoyl reductase boa5 [Ciborinia camelliae]